LRLSRQVVTVAVTRKHKSITRLAAFGIDPDAVLAEANAETAENTRKFLKRLTEDVALILVGGTPEFCWVACRACGERKSTLSDFHFYHAPNGKRIRRNICKSCVAKQHQQYIDRDKTVTALRRKLAEIEKASVTCNRCQQKKPPTAFPPDGRSCLQCKVEVLEALNRSLREQIVCKAGRQRVGVLRRQARGEYAGKRLQHAISQSDGTLSVEVLGRMFANAEGKPCPYCGAYMNRRTKTMDHMVPLSKGGVHGIVNVIISCNRCNSSKRDRDFGDWASRLDEPYRSVMIAEYEQRYGSKPSQSLLPLQYAPVSTSSGIQ
jgi:5-methylcytosine-specific restriction endonuclease McrA